MNFLKKRPKPPAADSLAGDLLTGAKAIALCIYGTDDATARSRVYRLAETGRLPIFRVGRLLTARKSELQAALSADKAA